MTVFRQHQSVVLVRDVGGISAVVTVAEDALRVVD